MESQNKYENSRNTFSVVDYNLYNEYYEININGVFLGCFQQKGQKKGRNWVLRRFQQLLIGHIATR